MYFSRLLMIVAIICSFVYAEEKIDYEKLNEQGKAEGWSFEVGKTGVSDIPIEQLCGLVIPDDFKSKQFLKPQIVIPADRLPTEHDWRALDGCTPIKNQKDCGSCWAFAAASAAEAAILMHTGEEVDFSEQWLVSCTDAGSCTQGGFHTDAFEYIVGQKQDDCEKTGAALEKDFPYMADDVDCTCPSERPYEFLSYGLTGDSIVEIKNAILRYGSVAVAVYADEIFSSYKSGIYNRNVQGELNHAVNLVGWDDNQGENGVWILRNSWGNNWGENGYMKIEYGMQSVGSYSAYIEYTTENDPNSFTVPTDEYPDIKAAVLAANNGDVITLLPGIYTGEGNRNISFGGKSITIISSNPSDAWTVANTVIDLEQSGRAFKFNAGETKDAVVWGITIRNGFVQDDNGGAIFCHFAHPSIRGCIFENNAANGYMRAGGAIACYNSSPIIKDCTFISNSSGYYGGAISCRDKSAPAIVNCRITGNTATFEGGGIYCWVDSQPYIKSTLISNNSAGVGAGVYLYECDSNDPNNVSEFVDPCAKEDEQDQSETQALWGIDNCTIADNIAASVGAGIFCMDSIVSVRNSIVWNNTLSTGNSSQIALFDDSLKGTTMDIVYSDIMGGHEAVYVTPFSILNYDTTSNIDADPLFANPSNGNYYLMSSAGRWDADISDWVLDDGGNFSADDDMNSPCIDAGDPESGYCLEPKCNGSRINMGAYGNTPMASRAYEGECCMSYIPGDLNDDCRVNLEDMMVIATHWLECEVLPRYHCGS